MDPNIETHLQKLRISIDDKTRKSLIGKKMSVIFPIYLISIIY